MNHDQTPRKSDVSGRLFAQSVMAGLFWFPILAAGVSVLAVAAILVGAAVPFRYVGF